MTGRNWKAKTGKSKKFEQSLFDHTMVELDALITLLPILRDTFTPPFTEEEEKTLMGSIIGHDVGKELDEWQEYVHGRRGFLSDVDRRLTEEVVPQLAELFDFGSVEEAVSNVLLHMRGERSNSNIMERVLFGNHTNPRWRTLAEIVDSVDNFCSAPGLFNGLNALQKSRLGSHIHLAHHLVQLRGVSTTLLHQAAMDAFSNKGWRPLLHYSNGTIYVTSSAAEIAEPTQEDIASHMAKSIYSVLPQKMAALVVGSPLQSMIPKPDLFDYRDLGACLQVSARKINRSSFAKKSDAVRRKTVSKYRILKGEEGVLTPDILALETERISAAQPEMCIFKFFKAALSEDLIGKRLTPEAQQEYSEIANGRPLSRLTPHDVAQKEYDAAFGAGSWRELQATSTLMQFRDMAMTVDHYWSLDGVQFDLNIAKVEHLRDDAQREQILINALVGIADKVYTAVPEENRPARATPQHIAGCFMADLLHPSPNLNLAELAKEQLQGYGVTKANARRDRGWHLCPVCNSSFEGGTAGKADFLDNPEAHTNRAVSHGNGGQIVICEACKFERFLQQLLLGRKVSDVIVLFPRMNIGHGSGQLLEQKAIQISEYAQRRMSEANPDPDQHISLGLSFNIARQVADVNVFRLTPAEIVTLITYRSGDETAKQHRRDLRKIIQEQLEVPELTVEVLNDNWDTTFATIAEAIEAVARNEVPDPDVSEARKAAFKLTPQLRVICQTPHMILIPLSNPISMGEESETNAAIRELYISLLLGLALDCSVAVVRSGEAITFGGGEGVARVPPVSALRELLKDDWIPIEVAQKWLDAIGAAALLAGVTSFPERSNLYAILSSPTTGHIMRRIDQQEDKRRAEGKPAFSPRQRVEHIKQLETVKGVLQ
ncbi:MAG: hypothetical protein JOZ57_07795 [Abitibacteriaceae bacterium]|nr:hypothetical protein [Abditibacteriaceae bacterium]